MANTNANFTIKKGMVFWMDVPSKEQPIPLPEESCVTKKRPYIVLSNEEVNTYYNLIHVAPITTKPPYEGQYFKVPFKKRDGSCCWINISNMMLVPKKFCTISDYSEAHTNMTLNNKELEGRLNDAMCKWFALTPTVTNETITNIIEEETTDMNTTENSTPNFIVPNINITINIPGMNPVSAIVNSDTVSNIVPIDVNIEKETSNDNNVEIKATSESTTLDIPEYKGKRWNATRYQEIMSFIKANSKAFGGNMHDNKIARALNISVSTVQRYKHKLNDPNWQRWEFYNKKSVTNPNNTSETVTNNGNNCFSSTQQEKEFMEYYKRYGARRAYTKYRTIVNFKNIQSCYNAYYVRKKKYNM